MNHFHLYVISNKNFMSVIYLFADYYIIHQKNVINIDYVLLNNKICKILNIL